MAAPWSKLVVVVSRPSILSDEVADAIFDRLSEGESLVQICRDETMPSVRTVLRWAAENSDFGAEYAHAREAQAEHMDDKILTAAEAADKDAAAARVKVDAYKWRAAKLAPKKYGDKIDVTSGGEKVTMDDTALSVKAASMIQAALARDGAD